MTKRESYEKLYISERAKKERLQDYSKELLVEIAELEDKNKHFKAGLEGYKKDCDEYEEIIDGLEETNKTLTNHQCKLLDKIEDLEKENKGLRNKIKPWLKPGSVKMEY